MPLVVNSWDLRFRKSPSWLVFIIKYALTHFSWESLLVQCGYFSLVCAWFPVLLCASVVHQGQGSGSDVFRPCIGSLSPKDSKIIIKLNNSQSTQVHLKSKFSFCFCSWCTNKDLIYPPPWNNVKWTTEWNNGSEDIGYQAVQDSDRWEVGRKVILQFPRFTWRKLPRPWWNKQNPGKGYRDQSLRCSWGSQDTWSPWVE